MDSQAPWMIVAGIFAFVWGICALRSARREQQRSLAITRALRLRRLTQYYESAAFLQLNRIVGIGFLCGSGILLIKAVTLLAGYRPTVGILAAVFLVVGKCLLSYRDRIHNALVEMSGAFPAFRFLGKAASSSACARFIILVGWLALLASAGCAIGLIVHLLVALRGR